MNVGEFVPQEQILQCTQSILITVSLVMFQYRARKAYYLRTGFSVVSKSYWFSIRKLHCISFLCYSPQPLQRHWLLKPAVSWEWLKENTYCLLLNAVQRQTITKMVCLTEETYKRQSPEHAKERKILQRSQLVELPSRL